jgi:hypothetical protein
MVRLHYEFPSNKRRFRVVYKEVLGLGLIMVYLYYGFALQGMRLMVA